LRSPRCAGVVVGVVVVGVAMMVMVVVVVVVVVVSVQRLRMMGNFAGLFGVMAALGMAPVHRLRHTFDVRRRRRSMT
jgi:hypothetical protein